MMLSCINLDQPWADAIIDGLIPVLVRKQPVNIRGKIGIRATEGIDGLFFASLTDDELELAEKSLVFGKVIGHARVVGCIPILQDEMENRLEEMIGSDLFCIYPSHYLPRSKKVFFWIIEEPKRYRNPIPVKSSGILWSKVEDDKVELVKRKNLTFWRSGVFSKYRSSNKKQ